MSLQPGATLGLTADDLVTGEAVALDLPAASLGMRMLSGLIDLFVLQMLASVVLTVASMFVLRADDAAVSYTHLDVYKRQGMSGRSFVTPDDVKALAYATLAHRLTLRPEAELEGVSVASVLSTSIASVPVPR